MKSLHNTYWEIFGKEKFSKNSLNTLVQTYMAMEEGLNFIGKWPFILENLKT